MDRLQGLGNVAPYILYQLHLLHPFLPLMLDQYWHALTL